MKVRCERCGKRTEWWNTVGWLGKRVCKECKEILKEEWIEKNVRKKEVEG